MKTCGALVLFCLMTVVGMYACVALSVLLVDGQGSEQALGPLVGPSFAFGLCLGAGSAYWWLRRPSRNEGPSPPGPS